MSEHEWLRTEGSYRSYIRGFRLFFVGFGMAVLFAALGGVARLLPGLVFVPFVLGGFGLAFVGLFVGAIGWLLVPDKVRIGQAQLAFIRMVARDVVRGIPKGPDA
jgi:hypothetical protein